jgi:hypothetical protein
MRQTAGLITVGMATAVRTALLVAQSASVFLPRDHAAVQYSTRATDDAVARMNQRIRDGQLRLTFDNTGGYLKSVLAELDISLSSQTLVFSENSLQREHISKATPRALYFNDFVAVGFTNGSGTLEVAAQDPTQGVIFYQLSQKPVPVPQFIRGTECLQCHLTAETSGVPRAVRDERAAAVRRQE